MLRLYDYECRECARVHEHLTDCDERCHVCPHCFGCADRIMSCPAIHTLETHMRSYMNEDKNYHHGAGEVYDDNIYDRTTGKAAIYSTLGQKKEALKKAGLYQKDSKAKRPSKKRKFYDGNSHRGGGTSQ